MGGRELQGFSYLIGVLCATPSLACKAEHQNQAKPHVNHTWRGLCIPIGSEKLPSVFHFLTFNCIQTAFTNRRRSCVWAFLMPQLLFKFSKLLHRNFFFLIHNLLYTLHLLNVMPMTKISKRFTRSGNQQIKLTLACFQSHSSG